MSLDSDDLNELINLLASCKERAQGYNSDVAGSLSWALEQARDTPARAARGGGCNNLVSYINDALMRGSQHGLPQDLLLDISQCRVLATLISRQLGV